MRPTPLFVLAITTIILVTASVWIIATLHNAAIDRQADKLLRTCVSETGHKPMPCPEEDQ